jgi:hemerythrin superfamily protein
MTAHHQTPGIPEDAIALLRADHDTVRELFRTYGAASDPSTKRAIAALIGRELEIHAELEATVFYPAFHAVTDDEGKQLIAEAVEAHQTIQEVLEELHDPDLEDAAFEACVLRLMTSVEDHMDAEEHAMFPFAAEDLADQLADLLDEMQELKRQLLAS